MELNIRTKSMVWSVKENMWEKWKTTEFLARTEGEMNRSAGATMNVQEEMDHRLKEDMKKT